jgi:hypothetical protein
MPSEGGKIVIPVNCYRDATVEDVGVVYLIKLQVAGFTETSEVVDAGQDVVV